MGFNFTTGDTVLLPIIRRVYPSAIAGSLVSVQPMAKPSGMPPISRFMFRLRIELPKNLFHHGKVGDLATIYRHYAQDDLREARLENNEVRYYKEYI
jgi:hypothetical protein